MEKSVIARFAISTIANGSPWMSIVAYWMGLAQMCSFRLVKLFRVKPVQLLAIPEVNFNIHDSSSICLLFEPRSTL